MANAVEAPKELKVLTATRENHLLDLSPYQLTARILKERALLCLSQLSDTSSPLQYPS